MNCLQSNFEDILNRSISGYHQYRLTPTAQVRFVSDNLCRMLGCTAEELVLQSEDGYARFVHPADREQYDRSLRQLAQTPRTLQIEYRLVAQSGAILWVRDTLHAHPADDGAIIADSVLTDITDLKKEQSELQFLNQTIPCGFLKYTCEKQPRITYLNQTMLDLLGFAGTREGEPDQLELYQSNIFLMIPIEERRRFARHLEQVCESGVPLAGEMTLLRCDGTRAYVFGWVTKNLNEQGQPEFQSVCMDVTERHKARKDLETKRYLKALSEVYDKIFEFNLDANTVKCLHSEETSTFKPLEDITIQTDDALDKWVYGAVEVQDRENIQSFFRRFGHRQQDTQPPMPPQITYRAKSSDGQLRQYSGLFIKIDESTSLYCCRRVQDTGETDVLRSQNSKLKENMKDLVTCFSDGLAAFELTPAGLVKPLYASENVCDYFGYTRQDWLQLTETYTTLEEFVAGSEASYEEYLLLLRNGEAEFTYFDHVSQQDRKIRAVCSQKESSSNATRYIMLYAVADAPAPVRKPENQTVSIRTFGYFDVFVGDQPIAFRHKKAKELLALLTDRRGGYVTSEEAISFLWEDEPATPLTQSRYRKVALRLKNTLAEYGIADIIESVDGKRRIVMEKVRCDLYQYLSGQEEYAQLFKGSYLTNYSWAETTLGELYSTQEAR